MTQVSECRALRDARHDFRGTSPEQERKLEVVLNRVCPAWGRNRTRGEHCQGTAGPSRRKVPSDDQAVRRAQDAATALVAKDGSISKAIFDMARSASGTGAEVEKKKFSLFRR